jgi:hypothetical protein
MRQAGYTISPGLCLIAFSINAGGLPYFLHARKSGVGNRHCLFLGEKKFRLSRFISNDHGFSIP